MKVHSIRVRAGAAILALFVSGCMTPPANLDLALDKPTVAGLYRVALQPPAQMPGVNQMHSWKVTLATAKGAPVRGATFAVDGGMPQHGHGLPTQPRVTRELEAGVHQLEGMKFSMTGWWEVKLAIDGPAGADKVTFNTVVGPPPRAESQRRDAWSAREIETLASMRLSEAGALPADPSNAHERKPEAVALGRALFHDKRLSRNGEVACATCHAADKQFQDDRALGQGVATGQRRTMPIMGAAHSPFLFWDGRKDSLWSQALGPLEDAAEHGGNRLRFVKLLESHYRDEYQAVFGPMPRFRDLPDDASPVGTHEERAAWTALAPARRDQVNRAFANMGKAIAAFERGIAYGESRFDRYAQAIVAGDARGQEALTPQEVRGLRVFLTTGQCATCHNGPLFTDHAFHNTGVPPLDSARPDRGRADGVKKLLQDVFNCLGPYSDAKPEHCAELKFANTNDPSQVAAFRTPSLRNVAARAPYMHAGQFATLDQVVQHYAASPRAVLGHSELAQPGERHAERETIRLSPSEMRDVAAFLGALTGPVAHAK
ncbi:cytochrome c peroxidase [Ramlibacter sp.]|uniref:cytochrome c peroxidase n=1 Tax=Ramlibacter sp. TaxID=1917967 RepID=UPI003D12E416